MENKFIQMVCSQTNKFFAVGTCIIFRKEKDKYHTQFILDKPISQKFLDKHFVTLEKWNYEMKFKNTIDMLRREYPQYVITVSVEEKV